MCAAIALEPARKIVSTTSVLEMCEVFPLALLPHLILFFAGSKPAIRLVLKNNIADSFQNCMRQLGYECMGAPISITQVGSHWGQLVPNGTIATTSHRILVASVDSKYAEYTLSLELHGESSEAGRLLGYPECCVDAYESLAREAQRWPDVLLARSPEPLTVSMWCNRLASLWGGTCPTGELFPCSLQCPHAISYGKLADKLLRENDCELLANEICRQSLHPIHLVDGEIVVGSTVSDNARELKIVA
jgi:hypothetical protein